MYVFYVDESGVGQGQVQGQGQFFVLLAMSVDVNECCQMNIRVRDWKVTALPYAEPQDWEIKGRDIICSLKLFSQLSWGRRVQLMNSLAGIIGDMNCKFFGVVIDKNQLSEIDSDEQLYRMAFCGLLEELEKELSRMQQLGIMLMDSRSTMHSSVQDRRLVDVYWSWYGRKNQPHFFEPPWFGFSAFYPGLQLADFIAYLIYKNSCAEQRDGKVKC